MAGSYDYRLVALSMVIAVMASYTALDLGGRVTSARGWARLCWLVGGGATMGLGIWSMHYVGMLAFRLPVPVRYHWPTALLSLLIAFAASVAGLWMVSRRDMGVGRLVAGSLAMGAAIAGLHYVSMESMRLPAMCEYSVGLVTLSVVFAIVFSLMALRLTFQFRDEAGGRRIWKVSGALLMGAAICVMHYTGMAAARFTPAAVMPDLSRTVSISVLGAAGVGIISTMVLVIAMLTSTVDRLQNAEARFRTAFVNSAIGVAMTDASGRFVNVNRTFCRLTGYSEGELKQRDWVSITHPDDRERNLALGTQMLAGELPSFLIEKRYVTKSGETVWVRNSTSLLEDVSGAPQHVIALVEDITEHKRSEHALQRSLAQLRALTARLQSVREEERTRVAREIHDELGQALTAIKIDVASLIHAVPADEQPQRNIQSILRLVDETIQSVRRIATELRPGILDDLGLIAAVEWAADEFQTRTGTTVNVDVPDVDVAMDPERATALFRIFQETLTNIARHAHATEVSVRLTHSDSHLTLEVQDNGRGMDEAQLTAGRSLGIVGMRERALLVGAELTIRSTPGDGTTVMVDVRD